MRRCIHQWDSFGRECERCGIDLEMFHDVVEDEVRGLEAALRNVLALALRMQRKGIKDAEHLVRFCAEVGIVPRITRVRADAAKEGGG